MYILYILKYPFSIYICDQPIPLFDLLDPNILSSSCLFLAHQPFRSVADVLFSFFRMPQLALFVPVM